MKIYKKSLMLALIATLVMTFATALTWAVPTTMTAPEIIDTGATPGTTIFAAITVDDVNAMWGAEFDLVFDSRILKAVYAEEILPFTKTWGLTPIIEPGKVTLALSMDLGEPVGLYTTDPVVIAMVYFEVVKDGYTALDLQDTVISDIGGYQLTHTPTGGFFANVLPKADFAGWKARVQHKTWRAVYATNDVSANVKNYEAFPVAVEVTFTLKDMSLWTNSMTMGTTIPAGGTEKLTWTLTMADLAGATLPGNIVVTVEGDFDSDGDGFVDTPVPSSPVSKKFRVP